MGRKRFEAGHPRPVLQEVLAGRNARAVLARRALIGRKLPPEDGGTIPAAPPKKPKPIIDGAEAQVE